MTVSSGTAAPKSPTIASRGHQPTRSNWRWSCPRHPEAYSRRPEERARRGPYGCFQARTPEKTKELYDKLRSENVITSLREGKIRVSPYLYNNERDIDRVITVITA